MNIELKKQLEKMADTELYSGLLLECNKQVKLNKKRANQFNIYSGEQIVGEAFLLIDKVINRTDIRTIDDLFKFVARDALRYIIISEKETESNNFEFVSIEQSTNDDSENNILDLYLIDYISRPTEKAAIMNVIVENVIDDKTDAIILNCIKRGEPLTEAEKLAKKANTTIMQRKTKLIKRLNKIYTEE